MDAEASILTWIWAGDPGKTYIAAEKIVPALAEYHLSIRPAQNVRNCRTD